MKNIGIDLVKKDRLTENVISRFMSKREIDLMNASYTTDEAKQQFAAGRWAAKESIVKASSKKIIFSDIEILAGLCGKPTIYINGEKTEDILVSISHEDEHSIAVAIIK